VTPPVLSIVVPCFNEEDVLPETAGRLKRQLDGLVCEGAIAPSSHACFVDDGSKDRTWSLIEGLNAQSARFRGLKLSRNRGHQAALMAGLLNVDGDLVISIDADLQDDPEAIVPMLRAAAGGADIVYGVRSARAGDTVLKRQTAHLYYRLLGFLGVEIVFNHADFRLLSRRVVEALREYEETNLFLRALIPRLGFVASYVEYERAQRFAGKSKYSLPRMVALAIEGVTSFSNRPLRLITMLGCATALLSLGLTVWALCVSLIFKATIPGWASIVIPVYLVCGVQLLCLGVIGEYVGKIYLETKRRPRFHVTEMLSSTPGSVRLGCSGWGADQACARPAADAEIPVHQT
jgi:glycosyltransferase involved in cell wall biosynthesis